MTRGLCQCVPAADAMIMQVPSAASVMSRPLPASPHAWLRSEKPRTKNSDAIPMPPSTAAFGGKVECDRP